MSWYLYQVGQYRKDMKTQPGHKFSAIIFCFLFVEVTKFESTNTSSNTTQVKTNSICQCMGFPFFNQSNDPLHNCNCVHQENLENFRIFTEFSTEDDEHEEASIGIHCYRCSGPNGQCGNSSDQGTLENCTHSISTCSLGKMIDRKTKKVWIMNKETGNKIFIRSPGA